MAKHYTWGGYPIPDITDERNMKLYVFGFLASTVEKGKKLLGMQ